MDVCRWLQSQQSTVELEAPAVAAGTLPVGLDGLC